MKNPEHVHYFFRIKSYKEIEEFIKRKYRENTYLEFKTFQKWDGGKLEKKDKENLKKILSKTYSAFANQKGGTIVWGIFAKDENGEGDVAQKLIPIKKITKFLDEIEKHTPSAIQPSLNISHKTITINNESNEGFIVTHVPKSTSLHLGTNSKRDFYLRLGGRSQPMTTETDLRFLLIRNAYPKLELVVQLGIGKRDSLAEGVVLDFYLKNTGEMVSKYPAVSLKYIPNYGSFYDFDENTKWPYGNFIRTDHEDYPVTFISNGNLVIHPQQKVLLGKLHCNMRPYPKEINYICFSEGVSPINGICKVRE